MPIRRRVTSQSRAPSPGRSFFQFGKSFPGRNKSFSNRHKLSADLPTDCGFQSGRRARSPGIAGVPIPPHPPWPLFTEGIKLRLIKSLFSSNSRYAVLMITELYNLDQQINHPGTADEDNWRFRLPRTLADIRSSPQLSGDGNKLAAIISITRRS
jgi:hypothetical protein